MTVDGGYNLEHVAVTASWWNLLGDLADPPVSTGRSFPRPSGLHFPPDGRAFPRAGWLGDGAFAF